MIRKIVQSAICLLLVPMLAAGQENASGGIGNGSASDPKASGTITLPKHRAIRLKLLETISSATGKKGQFVRMAVAEDFVLNGVILIPRGTPATGVVTSVRKAVSGKKDGRIRIQPVHLDLGDSTPIALRDYRPSSGGGECTGFRECMPLVAISLPFMLDQLVAISFQSDGGAGSDKVIAACSQFDSEAKGMVILHPIVTGSAQYSLVQTDLNRVCP
jgi:hypothetical protein